MEIKIDLEKIIKHELTPNEYVALVILNRKLHKLYPVDVVLERLVERGFVEKSGDSYSIIRSDVLEDSGATFDEWIASWQALWPTMLISNTYRVSGNTAEVRRRMKKFLNDYKYTQDDVYKATVNYIKRLEKKNYEFMKKNSKFIYDIDGSMLEQECEALLRGEIDSSTNNQIYK